MKLWEFTVFDEIKIKKGYWIREKEMHSTGNREIGAKHKKSIDLDVDPPVDFSGLCHLGAGLNGACWISGVSCKAFPLS